MSKKAMKLATEFNRYFTSMNGVDVPERVSVPRDEWRDLLNALQEALAQERSSDEQPAPVAKPHEQSAERGEPVGYVAENGLVDWNVCAPPMMTDLYTSPPAQRKPLTDEEILHLVDTHVGAPSMAYPLDSSDWINFSRAIEAAHGIKENT